MTFWMELPRTLPIVFLGMGVVPRPAVGGALQIYGGNGLSREYPIEKLVRDARASMIEDGCNDLLSLVGASKL